MGYVKLDGRSSSSPVNATTAAGEPVKIPAKIEILKRKYSLKF